MAFYKARDTPLARAGLTALSNTMAGIYFIPFKTGISLQVAHVTPRSHDASMRHTNHHVTFRLGAVLFLGAEHPQPARRERGEGGEDILRRGRDGTLSHSTP